MNRLLTVTIVALTVVLSLPALSAQSGRNAGAKPAAAAVDVAATLKQAADELGMLRTANRIDAINTMELWGSGTSYAVGQQYKADGAWPAFKTEWHATLSYADAAMRVEMVRNNPDGPGPIQGGGFLPLAAPQTLITVVSGKYAWNESEVGAGLVAGKGVATPAAAAVLERQAQLWTMPHGAVKAAIMAGAKATAIVQNGMTVITFPLPGDLAGVNATMTLDEKKLVSKVETRLDNPVLGDMINGMAYSDYGPLDEVQTDVMVPRHIVQTQGGFPVVDIRLTRSDTNNPYEIFPVPDAVMRAAAQPAGASTVDVAKVGDGVYYLTGESHHSVAVEFRNYVALVECPLGDQRALAVIDAVKKTISNKPIRYVVNTHHHFDHSGGLRACAAEGATILTQAENKPYYEKVWALPHLLAPDRLAKVPRKPSIEAVLDKRVLSDGTQSIEIYKMQGSDHDSSMLIAYVPKARLLIEADAYTPGAPNGPPPAATKEIGVLSANVQRLNLDVEQVAPIHGRLVKADEFRRAVGRAATN